MNEWKKIDGFERYEVSNSGLVRRLGKVLKPRIKSNGYIGVALFASGVQKPKHFSVHRLVAMAFIPNPWKKPWVDHINFDKSDNRVENLRWVTPTENNHAADRAGRRHAATNPNRAQKLVAADVAEIRRLASEGLRTGLIAERFDLSCSHTRLIVRGKSWGMPN